MLQASCPSLIGFDYGPLAFADAASAAALLKERERVKTFAQIIAKEAEILELKGDSSAGEKRRFALELWAEAIVRGTSTDAGQKEAIRALIDRGDGLSETYRATLDQALAG